MREKRVIDGVLPVRPVVRDLVPAGTKVFGEFLFKFKACVIAADADFHS